MLVGYNTVSSDTVWLKWLGANVNGKKEGIH
jgi:hypothetical protein